MRCLLAWRGALVMAIGVQDPGLYIVGQIIFQRFVEDALEQKISDSPPLANQNTRLCSRKRPTTERTRILSEMPGTPGLIVQAPRTIRSMRTPAHEALYRSSTTLGSFSAFILAMMRAGFPVCAYPISRSILCMMLLCRLNGDC